MVYIKAGDRISLQSFSCVAAILNFYIQIMTKQGLRYFSNGYVTNATGVYLAQEFRCNLEGEIVAAEVALGAPIVQRGDIYCSLVLVNGEGAVANLTPPSVNMSIICQGYVHYGGALRLGQNDGMLSGRGSLQYLVGVNPAPGANFLLAVPANQYWRLKQVYCLVTTAVGGAARAVYLSIDNAVNVGPGHYTAPSPITQAASLGYSYEWTPNRVTEAALIGGAEYIYLPPDLDLRAAFRLGINVGGIQAGDQISAIYYTIERWMRQYT